ncbi:MAG: bifunctional pyr operon transcriptional regulator/uracil phosphoribosyltransferase PyrR [Planctomycetota bacterium]
MTAVNSEGSRESGAGEAAPRTMISGSDLAVRYEGFRAQIEDTLKTCERPAIVGIKRGGAVLGKRLWSELSESTGRTIDYGEVDISLYRDDYHLQVGQPDVRGTEVEFPVEGTSIILVDDVLFTGRTVRAALDQLLDFGRPRRVWLGALVDRGGRELPIEANFVACHLEADSKDRVKVFFREQGHDEDSVQLYSGAAQRASGSEENDS